MQALTVFRHRAACFASRSPDANLAPSLHVRTSHRATEASTQKARKQAKKPKSTASGTSTPTPTFSMTAMNGPRKPRPAARIASFARCRSSAWDPPRIAMGPCV